MSAALPAYFDAEWYLRAYPDVALSGTTPARHYRLHGRAEGRLPCFLAAMARERDFKQGLLPQAGFAALLSGPDPAERAWASIALARHAATNSDWRLAETLLTPLDPSRDLVAGFGLPDVALLAIESAVLAQNPNRARQILRLAQRSFGRLPDLALAQANIIAAETGMGGRWQLRIAALFARAGLGGFSVAVGDGPAFDRLRAGFPRPRPRTGGPLVSVLMPVRNGATTIRTALSSLSAQSWRNLEILVIDNGSTDGTAAIVQAAALIDPRIRLLDGAAEIGAYPARNIGMQAAQGEFITLLDADDWAHPARISLQLRALVRQPQAAASVSYWVRTTPDLRFTRWWGDDGHLHRNISSLMIRAELRTRLGYWDRARVGADSEYYRRIQAVFGKGAVVDVQPDIPLSLGRVGAASLTGAAQTSIASQHFGARRSYDQAAARWHRHLTDEPRLPLPQFPARRPFPVPPALSLSDPAPAPLPADRIIQSGHFDERWYMQTYPDLRAQGVDGAAHYLDIGGAEGRDPGPKFSSSGYWRTLAPAQNGPEQNPLLHALDRGHADTPLPEWQGDLPRPPVGKHHLFVGHQAKAQLFGAERSLLDMLARAIATGVTPSVVLPHMMSPDYLAALRPLCHRIHVLPFGWRFGAVPPPPETVSALTALIRRVEAVELHQNTAVLAAPLAAARAAGISSTVHVRELPAQDPQLCHELGLPHWEWRAQLLAEADRFVANSQAVLDWLSVDPARLTLVPNRVDPALFCLPPPEFTLPLRVALIGSLTQRKGLGDMVRLARAAKGLPLRFVLIGPSHADLAAQHPLPDNLTHAGYVEGAVLAMAQADIVLCLSHFAESYGRSVAEAMAAARPVITYARGTPPVLVGADGVAGCITPPDDPLAVLACLRRLLANPAHLHAMSHAARARAHHLQD